GFWDHVNFDSPDTAFAEINDKNVIEKANDRYVIYRMNDRILFDDNKSDIRPPGEKGLRQIGASLNQKFKDADVKIYSLTDSSGEKQNSQLARQRAESVKNFLIKNSKMNDQDISIFPVDESRYSTHISTGGNQPVNTIEIVAKR
ncbi:MAG: OmpA family protein, partial [Bacteroidota bacterium]|nr:OmpA family protein [Bacteroidota bacterium]